LDSKRALDLSVGLFALVAAAPILVGVGMAMRLSGDRGPFLYRARRVGAWGKIISVLKVRTMTDGVAGPSLTVSRDPRVTRLGWVLRRYKIDELPQLVNVVRGEMSLVGPRPEDPRFVDLSDPLRRRVLAAKPGITGPAQVEFHAESDLLGDLDPEARYRTEILPAKLRLDAEYLDHRTTWSDIRILALTIATIFRRRGSGD